MFNIYIQRIADLHGVTHTRAAYEQAIERLPEKHARQMCLRFADLERKLGEVDRARAVYAYAAQMCDPRVGIPKSRLLLILAMCMVWCFFLAAD